MKRKKTECLSSTTQIPPQQNLKKQKKRKEDRSSSSINHQQQQAKITSFFHQPKQEKHSESPLPRYVFGIKAESYILNVCHPDTDSIESQQECSIVKREPNTSLNSHKGKQRLNAPILQSTTPSTAVPSLSTLNESDTSTLESQHPNKRKAVISNDKSKRSKINTQTTKSSATVLPVSTGSDLHLKPYWNYQTKTWSKKLW